MYKLKTVKNRQKYDQKNKNKIKAIKLKIK